MKSHNKYTVLPFSIERILVQDANRIGKRMPFIHALIDVDVTDVRKNIREIRKRYKQQLSLTAYLLYCFSTTIAEDKNIHACKSRKNTIFIFDEVDVFFPLEIKQKVLKPQIILSANTKNPFMIDKEIHIAKAEQKLVIDSRKKFFLGLPTFIKDLFYNSWMKNPLKRKKYFGTAYFSAAGMFSRGLTWGIPIPMHTVGMFIGNIEMKTMQEKDVYSAREFLSITISVDHTIVDGADLGRFINSLKYNIANLINTLQ